MERCVIVKIRTEGADVSTGTECQSLLTQLKACKMLVGMPHRGETIRDTK